MKLVYTHENKIIVENARNYLRERADIEAEMRNEFASSAVGDLSPIQTWPELWVQEKQYPVAFQLIKILQQQTTGPEWQCPDCGEWNDASFEICWNCRLEHHVATR